jgi:ATP-dependent Zn protease
MKTTIVILTICILSVINSKARDGYLTYDEFIRLVEAGKIESVELTKYSGISGKMEATEGSTAFNCFASTGSVQDPLLNKLLKEHNVKISVEEIGKPDNSVSYIMGFSGLSMMIVPWVSLVLLILCFRRLGRIKKQNIC